MNKNSVLNFAYLLNEHEISAIKSLDMYKVISNNDDYTPM